MKADPTLPTVLFYRDFKQFSGGHLKVWHYYRHLLESGEFRPAIYFSKESAWTSENPWFEYRKICEITWDPRAADMLFLAGTDWLMLDGVAPISSRIPIVNLIQGIRHAEPEDIRSRFLSHKAIRICISAQVAESIYATGKVNGPIFVIPNAINLDELPSSIDHSIRETEVLVAGLKNRPLAIKISDSLTKIGMQVETLLTCLPRSHFLKKIGNAKVTLLLPFESEGFYLPAIEAMALESLLVCPDCIGNRSFCRDGVNCFLPAYRLPDIVQAVKRAAALNPPERQTIIRSALETVSRHTLSQEKIEFLNIMGNVKRIW